MSGADVRVDSLLRLIEAEPADAGDHGVAGRLGRICRMAVRVLPADGAGVTLMTRDARPAGTIAASSDMFRRLEDLQFTLGEGPCIEASSARGPVFEKSLGERGMRRWPAYAAAAAEQGVEAVFAFPIQVGAARLGVLDVYRYRQASLAPESLANALALAGICLDVVLSAQTTAPGAQAADGLGDTPGDTLGDTLGLSTEAYQAQGFLMIELGVSLADAMLRLRAHAYRLDRPLNEVARHVLAGTIVLSGGDL